MGVLAAGVELQDDWFTHSGLHLPVVSERLGDGQDVARRAATTRRVVGIPECPVDPV